MRLRSRCCSGSWITCSRSWHASAVRARSSSSKRKRKARRQQQQQQRLHRRQCLGRPAPLLRQQLLAMVLLVMLAKRAAVQQLRLQLPCRRGKPALLNQQLHPAAIARRGCRQMLLQRLQTWLLARKQLLRIWSGAAAALLQQAMGQQAAMMLTSFGASG